MERMILESQDVAEMVAHTDSGMSELNELQLTVIGGGCAEVCPY